MRKTETLDAHLHRFCGDIGGVSLQSQKIHSAVETWEPSTPTIC